MVARGRARASSADGAERRHCRGAPLRILAYARETGIVAEVSNVEHSKAPLPRRTPEIRAVSNTPSSLTQVAEA